MVAGSKLKRPEGPVAQNLPEGAYNIPGTQ